MLSLRTINLSGLPKSRTSTINPAMRKAIASKADNGARGLYSFLSKTEDIEAIFKTPEAITISNTANI